MAETTIIQNGSDLKEPNVEARNLGREWSNKEKIAFRIAFIFFILLSVPSSWTWVDRLFAIDLFDLNYRDLYEAAGYSPNFVKIDSEIGRWGVVSYINWGVALLAAIVIGAIWTFLVRKNEPKEYNKLYYWLRVIVRYRVAVGVIAFGYVKLFPTQMPYPSQAILNTNIIDFLEQKLYWYSVGIVPWYQVFLGFAEVFAGFLCFYRRTTALGAAFTIAVLFNIVWANHSYDGGVHVYSAYFVLLSTFLIIYDFPRIWNLLVNERYVEPIHYTPTFSAKWKRYTLVGIKYAIIFVYIPLFFYIRYVNYFHEKNPIKKEPTTPGLTNAKGYYQVTEFRLNDKVLPYSPFDSVRWQSATFEKWSTFTFKVNKPVQIDLGNGGPDKRDIDKNFELSGIAGGQRFFYYDADTIKQVLHLQDKNLASSGGSGNRERVTGKEKNKEKEKDKKRIKLTLTYQRPTESRIILSGLNERKDSIYVVLDRVDKSYPLVEGRQVVRQY